MFWFKKKAATTSQTAATKTASAVSVPVNGKSLPLYAAVCTDCASKGTAKDMRDINAADIRAGLAYPVADCEYGSHSSGFSFVGKKGWFNASMFNFYALDEEKGLLHVSIFDFPQFDGSTIML